MSKFTKLINHPIDFFLDSKVFKLFFNKKTRVLTNKSSSIVTNKPSSVVIKKVIDNKINVQAIKDKISICAYDEAYLLAKELWEHYAWNLELGLLLATIYQKQNKFEDAIFLCESLSVRYRNYRVLLALCNSIIGRGDKYNGNIENIFMDAIRISPEKNFQARVSFIRYLWGTKGCGPELLQQCNMLLNKDLSPSDHMLIATIFCESGRYLLAERQYLLAKKKDPDVLLKFQYFRLLEMLNLKGYLEGELSNIVSLIVDQINKGKQAFETYIKNNRDSFCIVGNGPSEVGKNNGRIIDKNKIVIRFNAYDVNYPNSVDYGNKTDIWVKTGNYFDIPRRDNDSFKLVIISGYNIENRQSMGIDLFLDFINSKSKICVIPNFIYEELFFELKATPSAGLAILYWIYKIIGPINQKQVFGFSFGEQKSNSSEHYFRNIHKTKYSSHIWSNEGIFIKKLLK